MNSTITRLRSELLESRGGKPHWTGELSASALSTATAISALSLACEHSSPSDSTRRYRRLIGGGMDWLKSQQNADGGYGDTDLSHSNIATSFLVSAAHSLAARVIGDHGTSTSTSDPKLQSYLDIAGGVAALRERYGSDKTFVVPILTNMAIAGLVPWKEVAALPFEAAVFPQSMYRFLGMPVVSYALPALVAIGQAKFLHDSCVWPWSWVRRASIRPTLTVLDRMQPESGGYLEATPLTSFVLMSLIASGRIDHTVVRRGLAFLEQSVTPKNSWPIDTNLATWVTSLSIHALSHAAPETTRDMDRPDRLNDQLCDWLLSCQHHVRHPFTGADPGGWGWSDLSGAVPDADDTPGAMIALRAIRPSVDMDRRTRIDEACLLGQDWLLGLQNRDGGWPTFCRGWGKLPFDRSSVDLTAHAIRALRSVPETSPRSRSPQKLSKKKSDAIRRGLLFLRKRQQSDGSWLPLWFGNQDRPAEDNPVYGTAKVLVDAPAELGRSAISAGIEYLVQNQNSDGGWGGGDSVPQRLNAEAENRLSSEQISTVEETALALEALASLPGNSLTDPVRDAILCGNDWLVRAIADDRHHRAWPIGFYFAKLWYHERLYPTIFALAALSRVDSMSNSHHDETS